MVEAGRQAEKWTLGTSPRVTYGEEKAAAAMLSAIKLSSSFEAKFSRSP